MKAEKVIIIFSVLLALTAGMAWGGGQQSGGSDKGVIEYWSVFTGADGVTMQAIVDKYNATNPAYTVNHRAMAADDLYLKLPLAYSPKPICRI
jgi:multiple sugar transport system substrate-binding protein